MYHHRLEPGAKLLRRAQNEINEATRWLGRTRTKSARSTTSSARTLASVRAQVGAPGGPRVGGRFNPGQSGYRTVTQTTLTTGSAGDHPFFLFLLRTFFRARQPALLARRDGRAGARARARPSPCRDVADRSSVARRRLSLHRRDRRSPRARRPRRAAVDVRAFPPASPTARVCASTADGDSGTHRRRQGWRPLSPIRLRPTRSCEPQGTRPLSPVSIPCDYRVARREVQRKTLAASRSAQGASRDPERAYLPAEGPRHAVTGSR